MRVTAFGADFIEDMKARLETYRPKRKGVSRTALRQLALALLKRAGEDYLLAHAGDSWLKHGEELLHFIGQREKSQILVRVSASKDEATTSISTCMPDQPFIVDSLRLYMQQCGIDIQSQVNMVLPIDRSKAGKLKSIGQEDSEAPLESITHLEVALIESAPERARMTKEISARLLEARAVVGDFKRMRSRLADQGKQYLTRKGAVGQEAHDFVEWLLDEHFVFMGMTYVDPKGKPEKSKRLGLSRLSADPMAASRLESRDFLLAAPRSELLVHIHKTADEATLHRRGKMDEVLLRRFDAAGKTEGFLVVHGLFTYKALQARGGSVPILSRKLRELIELEDVRARTYHYKSVVNAFNALPLEYLFGAQVSDIRQLIQRSLAAERSRRLVVHLSRSRSKRSAYLFVVMPRQNFNDELLERIQHHIENELGASYCDHRVLMSAYGVAVLHFYFTGSEAFDDVDHEQLESAVLRLSASWQDRFRDALLQHFDHEQALELYRLYQNAFSPRYQVSTQTEQVVTDCQHLEQVRKDGAVRFDLYWDAEDRAQNTIKLRFYESVNLYLTEMLPVLDNFGLTVLNSFTNGVRLSNGTTLYLDTFRFRVDNLAKLEQPEHRARFLKAVAAAFDGRMANDPLNRVLLPAELTWQQVDLLRSYQGYSKQLGNLTTPGSIWGTFVKHATIVRGIVDYFEARFGPGRSAKVPAKPSAARVSRARNLREDVLSSIDSVESFSEDRLLRTFVNLVDATLRTSYFAADRPYASITHKFDCAAVTSMHAPRPWREIYVHHREVQGVHLRGGRVARGGLRWSDRPDDFRTEILGLMTTQMVKNVVIVPAGAKGGFVLLKPPADRAELRQYADKMYELFINSLLDVTDNTKGSRIVPPANVVCYDDPDPYLVVAADKGTAHLSDTANRISQSRGFWLGDAFASGGSAGYDHKGIGITARGAWVCIRHHLDELGINPALDVVSVAGIGDMGGDVFGNGLLEHDTLALKAAFNHLHIFLDPNPDPKVSFRERKRLFNAKYGGWDAYDTKKISSGGGVFERQAKSIPLSAAVRKMLETERTTMSANDLVSAILKMPVDLLYNGGIGTYVRATTEADVAAADPSNDVVRIAATELQARVVGEGGNLGLTQAARIEFARLGGRINTDFIDNAGGVNTSDHEVNLKILFQPLIAKKQLTTNARNKLLAKVEPQVTADVLAANDDQALLLSLDERRSRANLAPFDNLMDQVARRFQVKRSHLQLPPVRDVDGRMQRGEGLVRPELAILSSYVKMMLYDDLVEDPAVELRGIRPSLEKYFPDQITKRFRKAVHGHHLGREIALTRLTNRIVDHTGATFFLEMREDCGAGARGTFEAYSMLSRASDAWQFKEKVLALKYKVPTEVRYDAMLTVETALRVGTRYLLEYWTGNQIREVLRNTGPYTRRIVGLVDGFDDALDPLSLARARAIKAEFVDHGVPAPMARRLALFRFLPHGLVVLDLAKDVKKPAKRVAADYFALGRASNIFGTLRRIEDHKATSYYDALALRSLRLDVEAQLSALVRKLSPIRGTVEEKMASLGDDADAFAALDRIPGDQLGPGSLLVCLDRIRNVLQR